MSDAGNGTANVIKDAYVEASKETRTSDLPTVYFLGGHHPSNEPFIRSPPSNVRLCSRVTAKEFEEFGRLKQYSGMWPVMKKTNDALYRSIGMPRLLPVFGRYDLVHTNGSVIPLCPGPWVASIENPSAFYGFDERWHEIPRMRKRLASFLISERCRAIMPYSEASKRYLMMGLADWKETLELKTEVIPLAIDKRLIRKKPEDLKARDVSEKMRFLFVGNHFFDKGGREVLRAFRNIRDYHDSELTIVTSAPPHHSKEFQEYIPKIKAEKDVRFYHTGIPRSELMKLYDSSHVFAFPSYMDQVPFVFLEAMAAGLPLIGSNSYAMPEMSIDGSNGFVVESPWVAFPKSELRTVRHLVAYRSAVLEERNFDGVVENLIDKMKFLIDHEDTRMMFARESLEMVINGRYSLGCRNKALSAVYSRSLPRIR
ncbi:MAG: glycosyltransferase family 4 protein [Candidatus Thermoplasmatota archaeon]